MMVDRFDQDVTPFHIQYLLIMGGSNSLRAGVPAEDVIADLKTLQQKARERGIMPILLTFRPSIRPNIQKAFDEPTDENWQAAFAEVNRFIRTQPHIDVAAPFEAMGDELPTNLALDGIHGDWNMKKSWAGSSTSISENSNRYHELRGKGRMFMQKNGVWPDWQDCFAAFLWRPAGQWRLQERAAARPRKPKRRLRRKRLPPAHHRRRCQLG